MIHDFVNKIAEHAQQEAERAQAQLEKAQKEAEQLGTYLQNLKRIFLQYGFVSRFRQSFLFFFNFCSNENV